MIKRTTSRKTTKAVADAPVQKLNVREMQPNPKNYFEKLVPVLTLASLGLAFVVGILWQKVQNLEKGVATTPTQTTTQPTQQGEPAAASLDTIKGLFDKDLIKFGKSDSKLVFVEVADPSCPYCHVAAGHNPELNKQVGTNFVLKSEGGSYIAPVPEMKKLVDDGKASFIYIYAPGHGNGEMGMKALFCANEKQKFWQAHDVLMTNAGYNLLNNDVKNDKANSGKLADFLKSAVDPKFLKDCLDSGKYDAKIADNTQIATSIGIQGTPGFYVNDTIFRGAYSFTDMQSAVDAAL
jgi:Protein-disulfide isomerase